MKIVLTEKQTERLIENDISSREPGMPTIIYQDAIDKDKPEIKRIVDKMMMIYKVFKKGSAKVTTRQNQPFMVEYELPPIESTEFVLYMSRDEGVIANIHTEPHGSTDKVKFVITNFDEFPDIAEMGYTMETFVNKNTGVFLAGALQNKFRQFGIKIW